ncbi:MAG: DUF2231 domain-containing protein [Anaerolineae bacterium]
MESHNKFLGHPIHPILIVFPIGLLGTGVLFDLITLLSGNGDWSRAAYFMIGAGVVFGLVAAFFGFRDWQAIPDQNRAKRVGLAHGIINAIVLVLFLLSWVLRRDDIASPDGAALLLSFVGAGLTTLSGWLGGELVYRLGVGIDENAHLNASSSLSDAQNQTQPHRDSGQD